MTNDIFRRRTDPLQRLAGPEYDPKSVAFPKEPAKAKSPTAQDIMSAAAKHMTDRAAIYDKPEGERSMGATVEAFNAIAGRDLTEAEGWLLLGVLKYVRAFQRPGYHADSVEDAVSYAALMGEAKARGARAD